MNRQEFAALDRAVRKHRLHFEQGCEEETELARAHGIWFTSQDMSCDTSRMSGPVEWFRFGCGGMYRNLDTACGLTRMAHGITSVPLPDMARRSLARAREERLECSACSQCENVTEFRNGRCLYCRSHPVMDRRLVSALRSLARVKAEDRRMPDPNTHLMLLGMRIKVDVIRRRI